MHHQTSAADLIYVHEERVHGYVLTWGAHASLIQYSIGGIEYQVWAENTEFAHLGQIYEEVDY